MPPRARATTPAAPKQKKTSDNGDNEAIASAVSALEGDVLPEATPRDDEDQVVPAALVFTTPADEGAKDVVGTPFVLDDIEFIAFKPKAGMFQLLLGSVTNIATEADRIRATMDFMRSVLDEDSWMMIMTRLQNNRDPLDLGHLAKVMQAILKEWAPAQNRQQRRAGKRKR